MSLGERGMGKADHYSGNRVNGAQAEERLYNNRRDERFIAADRTE